MAVALTTLNGESLALVLWARDSSGSDDVAVFHGRMEQRGVELVLIRPDGTKVELLPEWHERIREVSDPKVAAIVRGARYALSLSLGSLPNEADLSELRSIGLKWPK